MSKISISVYNISINTKGNKTEELDLDDFEKGSDLLDLIKNLPSQFIKLNSDNKILDGGGTNRRTVIPDKDFDLSGRIISGYINSGDYGYETPIVNPKGETIGNVDKENSTMRPFYFFISIPKNSKKGYLLIQRFENFGVFTIFTDVIKKVFRSRFSDTILSFTPEGTDDKEALDYLEHGKIDKVKFSVLKPSNIESLFTNGNQNDEFNYNDIKAELVLSAKRGRMVKLKNTLLNLLKKGEGSKMKLTNQDIPYEKLKIYVKFNGEEKVIDLSKLDTFSKDIDVTRFLINDAKTGLPTKKSLSEKCHEILTVLIAPDKIK